MTKRFNRIVAYGCSWTAGIELMDHVHMGMSFDECNAIKKKYAGPTRSYEGMHEFNTKYDIYADSLVKLNQWSSWIGQLAKLLDVDLDNRAESGSGLDQIYLKIYTDLNNKKILLDDLVIVGLTTPYRTIKFKENRSDSCIASLQLGHHFRGGRSEDTSLIELFNDDYLIFSYFKTLSLIGNMRNKINLRLQPMLNELNPFNKTFLFNLWHTREYAKNIWLEIEPLMLLPDEFLKPHMVEYKQKKCGFLHEPVESHTELASKIFEKVNFND